ncbi:MULTISPECIES: TolC family protein [unclassified Leeuwenhoekiella]|uniref:TolC family protein n=1 Tax=unclassified Leeuwenhoekiella TaxID=2615029 RepID=UPI000C49FB0B|nr:MULTISPECIES: TolC family protein [unclassified Leeuwenhoekiella]MAW94767.1 transporter [Leeuwenhoekiella sp.]MAW95542.1 transporter [Leeuwenhoekiella sp.]MBA82190.1 transporter [Leeuwenhoekiella sp.]|tara:strand:- start:5082 stop:6410 length:1329 start_codon:yes stop_codon:yes gene_type:complete
MKTKSILALLILLLHITITQAQDSKPLTLEEVVQIALQSSDASKINTSQIDLAKDELRITKNRQYPDLNISGQYRYLTNANVNLQIPINSSASEAGSENQNTSSPKVNGLLLGSADVSMPLFAGFKLKNSISASENQLQAAVFNAANDQEKLALQAIQLYLNLYKANATIDLVKDNLKSANQRVKDFTNMEENGLLARNDLLKAQLQQANIELALANATKNARILNYNLTTLLKLPEDITINTDVSAITPIAVSLPNISNRNDLQALSYQQEALQDQIKVSKGDYYPSLGLVGGYIALDLNNALTVTNAMNVGLGLSYNLSSLFKTKAKVKLAESQAQELSYRLNQATSQAKVNAQNALEEYNLAIETFEVYEVSKEQALENYRIVKDKYDNGLSDTNDLLEADVQQLQTRIDLAYAKADITLKYYELLSAEGVLTKQFFQN